MLRNEKTFIASILLLLIFGFVIIPQEVSAPPLATDDFTPGLGGAGANLGKVGEGSDFSADPLPLIIGRLIKVLLGLFGLIALIVIIVGGVKWMSSGGNEEKILEAKKLMSAGIIGLVIIAISYAAATFVTNRLLGPDLGVVK